MSDTLVESVVQLPVLNPDTKGCSRTFSFFGVLDKLEDGTLTDWKTTADPQRFIQQRAIAFQAELYAACLQHAGTPITRIVYCLITVPTIQLCGPTYRYAVMKEGRKSAAKVFDTKEEAEKLVAIQGYGRVEERITGDASRDAYEERCMEWLAQPGKLVEHELFLNPARIRQAKYFLWDCSKRILDSRRNNRWLPSAQACYAWNRPCAYLPLCEAVSHGADPDWIIEEQFEKFALHPELPGVGPEALEVLTQTSLGVLTLCEVMYYWRYERGIRPQREDSEALWTGSATHVGLQAYATAVFGRLDAAYAAIDEWERNNPALGDGVRYAEQQIARARAIVRAAAERWAA